MQHLAPMGETAHSGTYSGHLFQLLSVEASIRAMSEPGFYERINSLSRRLYDGLSQVFEEAGVTAVVQGLGARFGLIFGISEAADYRQARGGDSRQLDAFIRGCFERGFTSTATAASLSATMDSRPPIPRPTLTRR